MSIIARFFPNGEFSQGVDTSKKRKPLPSTPARLEKKACMQSLNAYLQWKNEYESYGTTPDKAEVGDCFVSASGNKYFLLQSYSISTSLYWQDERGGEHTMLIPEGFQRTAFLLGLRPLVHQSVESCDSRPNRKKLATMTKSMSRNIRNAVYLLERQPGGNAVLSFLTLTLPDLSTKSLEICCRNWDAIVKRFFDWLRVTLKRRNIELQHVHCTEIQLKRLQRNHEYAPHLHVVFRGRNGSREPWAVTPKECRQAWKRSIAHFVDEQFDDRALENLQRVKRSAARYLSKYLSKGANSNTSDSVSPISSALRTQWGGMARSLSRAVRQATTKLDSSGKFGNHLSYFVSNLESLLAEGFIAYFKRGFISLHKSESDGTEYGIHVSAGALSTPTYKGGVTSLLAYIGRQLELC